MSLNLDQDRVGHEANQPDFFRAAIMYDVSDCCMTLCTTHQYYLNLVLLSTLVIHGSLSFCLDDDVIL